MFTPFSKGNSEEWRIFFGRATELHPPEYAGSSTQSSTLHHIRSSHFTETFFPGVRNAPMKFGSN